MRFLKILPPFFFVLLLAGCSTEPVSKEKIESDLQFKATAEKEQVPSAQQQSVTPNNKAMFTQAPEMEIDPENQYQATLTTTEGDIVVSLDAKATPKTVNNFVFLAKKNFYDGTIFHRTIPGFMIQGGDPDGTGMGGPGYKFPDEPFTGEYTRGTLAMANSGPNTNGSQFFIMHKDTGLPKNYVIFGKVTSGIEVVDKIADAPTKAGGEGSSPVTPVVIEKVSIEEIVK